MVDVNEMMTSYPVLRQFDPSKPCVLLTDDSPSRAERLSAAPPAHRKRTNLGCVRRHTRGDDHRRGPSYRPGFHLNRPGTGGTERRVQYATGDAGRSPVHREMLCL